ncbi:hypothetical protein [Plasmodium yoelii yoelii]|uniref:Uncharacterized protein n=1 Tax=Plasmodium yoelii yoelii TaxID=73239 RepID=Q7RD77_PLAYO|nr:hypothetical protein [Plasmodium yoelii yoelii]
MVALNYYHRVFSLYIICLSFNIRMYLYILIS